MIYTFTLNPSLDYTLSLEKLELGRVNRAAGETLAAGGKGLVLHAGALHQVCANHHAPFLQHLL